MLSIRLLSPSLPPSSQGLLVVHRKLKELGTVYPFVAMVTPNVGQAVRDCLEHAGIIVRQVDPLKPEDGTHALNEHDTRFEDTWTKLRSFGLTEYDVRMVLG